MKNVLKNPKGLNLNTQTLYESIIFLIIEIIKEIFKHENNDNLEFIEGEINRLFRSDHFNLFKNQMKITQIV